MYEAKFKEIQEAYHILSNPARRQEYNGRANQSFQTRSYTSTRQKNYTPSTPQSILGETIEFRKKISVLDPDRMNKSALFQQIQKLLSANHIHTLQQHNDNKLNKRIIEEILFCSRFLPFQHVEQICFQLTALAGTDNFLYSKIYSFSKQMRLKSYWNKYKIVAAIIISLLLCIAMYKVSAEF